MNESKKLPPQENARDMWLLAPYASMGRLSMRVDEYEELRAFAIKQAFRIEELSGALKSTLNVHDGWHLEDCEGRDELIHDDEVEECECGAVQSRNEARKLLNQRTTHPLVK